MVAEIKHLVPAGVQTKVDLELELYEGADIAGKTLTIAGETLLMYMFIPSPYGLVSEGNFLHAEFIFPDVEVVVGGGKAPAEAPAEEADPATE